MMRLLWLLRHVLRLLLLLHVLGLLRMILAAILASALGNIVVRRQNLRFVVVGLMSDVLSAASAVLVPVLEHRATALERSTCHARTDQTDSDDCEPVYITSVRNACDEKFRTRRTRSCHRLCSQLGFGRRGP